jgi:hypothetical protein
MSDMNERESLIQQYLGWYDPELTIIDQETWIWFDNIFTEFTYHIGSYIADLEVSEASAVPEEAVSIPGPIWVPCNAGQSESTPIEYIAANINNYWRYSYQASWESLWTYHF